MFLIYLLLKDNCFTGFCVYVIKWIYFKIIASLWRSNETMCIKHIPSGHIEQGKKWYQFLLCAKSPQSWWLFVIQWTVACQASLSMEFSDQEFLLYHLFLICITIWNAEFQRITRRHEKAILSDQCKEIEEK